MTGKLAGLTHYALHHVQFKRGIGGFLRTRHMRHHIELQRVRRDENAALLHYGDPQSYLPFAPALHRACAATSCRQSGGKVIVEEPTFKSGLALSRLHDVTPMGVALREDGMNADLLKRRLGQKGLRFLFTIPSRPVLSRPRRRLDREAQNPASTRRSTSWRMICG